MLHFDLHPFPVLTTQRLTLRAIADADLPAIFALRSDPELMKHIDRPPAKSIDEAKAWADMINGMHAGNECVLWVITYKDSDDVLGNIGIWQLDKVNHRAEIGYTLGTAHQKKGIMQEAMAAALDYAFYTMHLHSIEANVIPANQASINLLKKLGFMQEAYFKENYFYDGKFRDSAVYSLLTTKI